MSVEKEEALARHEPYSSQRPAEREQAGGEHDERKQERAIDHQQNDEHGDECDGKEKPVNSSEGFNQVSR